MECFIGYRLGMMFTGGALLFVFGGHDIVLQCNCNVICFRSNYSNSLV